MDIHRLGVTSMRIPTRPRTHDRPRVVSRSPSPASSDSSRSREPMDIPGLRYNAAPPPLPPPRYLEDLERGNDLAWKWGNKDSLSGNTPSRLAPIKASSSLYGGYLQAKTNSNRSTKHDDMDVDESSDEDVHHRGSRVSTIRSPSQASINTKASIPSLVRRPPSPPLSGQRLQGEQPLAQKNFNRSSHAYDQRLLSKIGKPNSPPRHRRSDSIEHAVLGQKLSVQTKSNNIKPQGPSIDLPPVSLDSVSRWVSSPVSTGVSPASRSSWRDYNMDPRSPSLDSTATSLILDPELFMHVRNSGRDSASGSIPGNDDSASFTSRSNRDSCDQAIFPDAHQDFAGEEHGNFRNANVNPRDSHHLLDKHFSRQGTKRRAISPPAEMARDDKPPIYGNGLLHKVTSAPSGTAPSSPSVTRYNPRFGSVSSTSSSVQHNSYASSIALSATGSSMTSISSFEKHSPSDPPYSHAFITSAPLVASPATSIPPSRKQPAQRGSDSKPENSKMSIQTAVNDLKPSATNRIGNYYICDCCPKKPKKFDREDELRVHQMEKQYSCQYCNNRFKNKNEAERHQNSLHLRRHSWSCAAISSYQAAFHQASPPTSQAPQMPTYDACGFCGEEFPNHPQPDWDRRIDHLTNIHKFGECNQSKKFFRADHFRQHLKHSHAGQSGKWTNLLESVCLREESPTDASGISPTSSEASQGRGPSSLPAPGDVPMGGATIDEDQEES